MESEIMELALPPAPRGLCFDRLDFVKTNFSVDNFLAEHQNATSLEAMRDDLGVYLKVLRLAMIELINKDYANFVNLSATLIDFDKSIEKIQLPLVQLKEEVLSVKKCIEDAMKELSMWLNQRHSLQKKKQLLKHYSQTMKSLNTLNKTLANIADKNSQNIIILAERGAMEYNQLKFSVTKCDSLLKQEQKIQFQNIGENLVQSLNELLFMFWNDNDEENLLKVFITLASLSKVTETEMLIRKKAVAPLLVDIINEPSLQKSKDGLQGIYEKVLSLLDTKFKLLLTATQHSKLSFLVNKYRFLVNCFWCEVESRIEINLASIFAPGNPKIFYKRYSESMQFIRRLEGYCEDNHTVELLHNTAEFRSFQKRWNLPVYFQIRFQEIAGAFEGTLQRKPTVDKTGSGFILQETKNCWAALEECWSHGVYIEALAHKFWKLTLQLILRYATWCNLYCSQSKSRLKTDGNSSNKDMINTSINLYLDCQALLQRTPELLRMVENKLRIENKSILRESMRPCETVLQNTKDIIQKCIVEELFENFNSHLKQVSDIPRLYRKTNRNVPSRPCAYIDVVAKGLQDFHEEMVQRIDKDFLSELNQSLFIIMTESYHKHVEEVLTSVQKTEESLRRLKQIREKTVNQNNESIGVTDGDKIRLQLKVDIDAYEKLAKSLQIDLNCTHKFKELNDMVTDAVKNIDIK